MFGALPVLSVLKSTNTKAPAKPTIIPRVLSKVMRSFIRIEARISTITGDSVTITELLIGVERLRPLKKNNILIAIPKTAQPKILGQSEVAIFSLGPSQLIPQNRIAAPKTLKKINPKGSI